ncbi:MAG: lysoplasmalogenase [Myxococcales bacterium]|nr:lysoplasmalogenase [Myxococcales bacterium]
MTLGILFVVIGLTAVLWAEWAGPTRPGSSLVLACAWGGKVLASTGFMVAALLPGLPTGTYGAAVVAALVLSFAGDLLLVPKGAKRAFLAGLVAFLLGHVAYAVAFTALGLPMGPTALAFGIIAGPAIVVGRYFVSRASAQMKAPVVAYIVVISAMVALASGATWRTGDPLLLLAAGLFYASDVFVARQRFVGPDFLNRAVGLPLYYAAQLIFALTLDSFAR